MSTYIQKNNLSEKIFNSIENIKGIGPKTVKLIKDKIGLRIVDNLLNLPIKYINRYQKTSIKNSTKGDYITVDVVIVEMNIKKGFFRRRIPSRIITFGLNNENQIRDLILYISIYTQTAFQNYIKLIMNIQLVVKLKYLKEFLKSLILITLSLKN